MKSKPSLVLVLVVLCYAADAKTLLGGPQDQNQDKLNADDGPASIVGDIDSNNEDRTTDEENLLEERNHDEIDLDDGPASMVGDINKIYEEK